MVRVRKIKITPGGKIHPLYKKVATGRSDSGETGHTRFVSESEHSGKPPKNKNKTKNYIGTLNIQTLIQPGKLHMLTEELKRLKIQILAVQETRCPDNEITDYNGFRIFKSGTDRKIGRGANMLGMAFIIEKSSTKSIKSIKTINNRLMLLRLKYKNKNYTIINVHAPCNVDNRKDLENVVKFWERLEIEISKIPRNDVKILLGDFNAQIGRERKFRKTVGLYPAHRMTNKNGMRLIQLCQQFNMKISSTSFNKKPKKQKTWRSPISQLGEFQIDHVAISYDFQKEIRDIQVRRGANIDSDHYLTRVQVQFTPKRKAPRTPPVIPKFDLQRITESETIDKWENSPANNWEQFKTKITKIAKEQIPLKKKPKHPWWNMECGKAVELRRKAFTKYSSNKNEGTHQNFLETRKLSNKIIRQEKRKYVNKQLESIETDFKNYNTHGFYKTFANQIKGYNPQNVCFRKLDGNLALSDEENCEVLAEYFEKLLNCPEPSETLPISNTRAPQQKDSTPPSEEEIIKIIKKLKNNKACGEDGIVAEFLKNLGPNSRKELVRIIQNIWDTEEIPEDWKCALIHPLHKKGDEHDVNNYRGISLLPDTYKILSACILERTQELLEPKISDLQAGFRPNRSCPEQILNLKLITRIRKMRVKPTVYVFVDFKKAYDSIHRPTLFKILEEKGLDRKTQKLIQQTLTNTKSKVKFMGKLSQPFEVITGVRQGDGLSPLLFNVVLDRVMEEWEKKLEENCWKPISLGTKKNNLQIPYLAFADDLTIMADSSEMAVK